MSEGKGGRNESNNWGRDFNARTSEEGGRIEVIESEEEKIKRRSKKDKKLNKKGRRLVE